MILSPQLALDHKVITSPDKPLDQDQIQQHGIDCRISRIYQIPKSSTLSVPGLKPETVEVHPQGDENYYLLLAGTAHSIVCHEYVEMPWFLGGEIVIRSTFNRNGVFGRSSWFDPGFCNYVGFTIYPFVNLRVKVGERIGQVIFHFGQPANLYNGSYTNKIPNGNNKSFKMEDENYLETGD